MFTGYQRRPIGAFNVNIQHLRKAYFSCFVSKLTIMEQHDKKPVNIDSEKQKNGAPDQPRTGVHSPDTDDAAADNVQESAFGGRSYASPDFFKKKPHL